MEEDSRLHHGACHCGAVRFTVCLSDGLASARRCNCSYCRMRGAVAVSAERDALVVTCGRDCLTRYVFHTETAEHYFCSRCGIYTHHRRRSNPDQLGINVACLAGISPFDFPAVPVNEGRHHPRDGGGGVAGMLYYRADGEAANR